MLPDLSDEARAQLLSTRLVSLGFVLTTIYRECARMRWGRVYHTMHDALLQGLAKGVDTPAAPRVDSPPPREIPPTSPEER